MAVLSSPQFKDQLRQIEHLNPVRMPVLRATGEIELLPEGYDAPTKSFTLNAALISTGMAIADARKVIDDMLREFTFADKGRSRAVALAAALTVFASALLPRKSLRPCFILLGNADSQP